MIANSWQAALDDIPDTGEIVIRHPERAGAGALLEAWRNASAEATTALGAWRRERTRLAYSVYRAAEDRADAALDVLASC